MFYAYIPAPNLGEMISLIVPEIDVVLIFMLMALSVIPNKNQNFKILAISHIRFSTIKNVNFLSGSEIRGVVCLCVCVSLFIGLKLNSITRTRLDPHKLCRRPARTQRSFAAKKVRAGPVGSV